MLLDEEEPEALWSQVARKVTLLLLLLKFNLNGNVSLKRRVLKASLLSPISAHENATKRRQNDEL